MRKLVTLFGLLCFALIFSVIGSPSIVNTPINKSRDNIRQINEISYNPSNRWVLKVPKNTNIKDIILLDPTSMENLTKQIETARWLSQNIKFKNQSFTADSTTLPLKKNNYNYKKVTIKKDGSVFVQRGKKEIYLSTFSKNYYYNPQLFLLKHIPAVNLKLNKTNLIINRTSNIRKQIIVGVRKSKSLQLYLINLTAINEVTNDSPLEQKMILPLDNSSTQENKNPPVVVPTPVITETPIPNPTDVPESSLTPEPTFQPTFQPTVQPTVQDETPLPVSMKDFWPSPKSYGRSLLRFYDFVLNGAVIKNHMIQRVKLNAETNGVKFLALEDWVLNAQGAYVWVSTWYLRIDANGTVTEIADATTDYDDNYINIESLLDLKYYSGKEILWGNVFNQGDSIGGSVIIDTSISTINTFHGDGTQSLANYPNNARVYGYNRVNYAGQFKNKKTTNGLFYSGTLFSLYQTFCGDTSCVAPQGWEVWVNYYMTPNIGPSRMDYYKRDEKAYSAPDQGSHELTLFCEADRESFSCS